MNKKLEDAVRKLIQSHDKADLNGEALAWIELRKIIKIIDKAKNIGE